MHWTHEILIDSIRIFFSEFSVHPEENQAIQGWIYVEQRTCPGRDSFFPFNSLLGQTFINNMMIQYWNTVYGRQQMKDKQTIRTYVFVIFNSRKQVESVFEGSLLPCMLTLRNLFVAKRNIEKWTNKNVTHTTNRKNWNCKQPNDRIQCLRWER